MKLTTALVASILSFTTLDARAAAPTDDAYSVTVRFADLDLNRQDGVAKLYLRIKGAARQVCHQQERDQQVTKPTYPVCVRQVVATAVARIGRPLLSDYVAQLGGQPTKTAPASQAAR